MADNELNNITNTLQKPVKKCYFIKPWLTVLGYEDNGDVQVRTSQNVTIQLISYKFDWLHLQYFFKTKFENYFPYLVRYKKEPPSLIMPNEYFYIHETPELYQQIKSVSDPMSYDEQVLNAFQKMIIAEQETDGSPFLNEITRGNYLLKQLDDDVYLVGFSYPRDTLFYDGILDEEAKDVLKEEYLNDPGRYAFEKVMDDNNEIFKRSIKEVPKDKSEIMERYRKIQEHTWTKMGERIRYLFFYLFIDPETKARVPGRISSLRDLRKNDKELIVKTKKAILDFYKNKFKVNYEDVFIYCNYSNIEGYTFHFNVEYLHPYSTTEFFNKDIHKIHTIDDILNNLKYDDYYQNKPFYYYVKNHDFLKSGKFETIFGYLNERFTQQLQGLGFNFPSIQGKYTELKRVFREDNLPYDKFHQIYHDLLMYESIVNGIKSVQKYSKKIGEDTSSFQSIFNQVGGDILEDAKTEFQTSRINREEDPTMGRYFGCKRNYMPSTYKYYYYELLDAAKTLRDKLAEIENKPIMELWGKELRDEQTDDYQDYLLQKMNNFKQFISKATDRIILEGYLNVGKKIRESKFLKLVERRLNSVSRIDTSLLDDMQKKIEQFISTIDQLQTVDAERSYKLLIKVNYLFDSTTIAISQETLQKVTEIDPLEVNQDQMNNLEKELLRNYLQHYNNLQRLAQINRRFLTEIDFTQLAVYKEIDSLQWKYKLENFVIRRFHRNSLTSIIVLGYFKDKPTEVWLITLDAYLLQKNFKEVMSQFTFEKIFEGVDGTRYYQAKQSGDSRTEGHYSKTKGIFFNYRITGRKLELENEASLLRNIGSNLFILHRENEDIYYRTNELWNDPNEKPDSPGLKLFENYRQFFGGEAEMIQFIWKHNLDSKFTYLTNDNSFLVFPDPKWVGKTDFNVLKEYLFNKNSSRTRDLLNQFYFVSWWIEPENRDKVRRAYSEKNALAIDEFKKDPINFMNYFRSIDQPTEIDNVEKMTQEVITWLLQKGWKDSNQLETFTRGNLSLDLGILHIHFKNRYSPFVTAAEKEVTVDRFGKTFNTFDLIDNLKIDPNYYRTYDYSFLDNAKSITFLTNENDFKIIDTGEAYYF